jgi:hypothetical protein
MGSLYPTDTGVGQRREREKKNVLCALFYQRTPVEEREKISGRYTLLYIYILFVVVGTAAAAAAATVIGSSSI